MQNQTLVVFAHSDEAEAFIAAGIHCLVTGVGKIQASHALTAALARSKPQRVIVFGTAGAIRDGVDFNAVYRVGYAYQHDYSLDSPVFDLRAGVPIALADVSAPSQVYSSSEIPCATIATGDVFVSDDTARVTVAQRGASLVDMETYAYAYVCAQFGVQLQVYKTPSDFADSSTTQDEWDSVVLSKSELLLTFAQTHVPDALVSA